MNEGARKSAFPWKIVQTHSADEDGMIWLIAPEPASEHWVEIDLLKNDLDKSMMKIKIP